MKRATSVILLIFLIAAKCWAGGGPENVVVVVNAASVDSLTVANHFIQLRNIPAANVIYLEDIPPTESTTIEVCREKILRPVLDVIKERQLTGHVDYIVYSSDFPTAIRLPPESSKTVRPEEYQKYFRPTASINAVTYFAQQVLAEDYTFLQPAANHYMRQRDTFVFENYYDGVAHEKYQTVLDAYQNKDYQSALDEALVLAKSSHPRPVMKYWAARCNARLGEATEALSLLEAAVKDGWAMARMTREDEAFSILADMEKFSEVVGSMGEQQTRFLPTRGFRSSSIWRPNGLQTTNPGEGRRYFLSVVLGCTRGKGNTVDEVVAALKRSVAADGKSPKGTFYFVSNKQIRVKTRTTDMPAAVAALKASGFKAETIASTLPENKDDVLGAMIGVASFQFQKSGSTILPGAICDNLTSFGGVMKGKRGKGQTTVSEFIAHGAAGSSGTVVEPYTIPHKFPHPMIHLHYARGASLAEAFYQSVHCPYQLLIVGDPLCRPFAAIPAFTVSGLTDGGTLRGKTKIEPVADSDSSVKIRAFELYFQGKRVRVFTPGGSASFDSTKVPDGHYEFRLVAIADGPLETRSSQTFSVFVRNGKSQFDLELQRKEYRADEKIEFLFPEGGGVELVVFHNSREVAKSDEKGNLNLDCSLLGNGPVRLRLVAVKENRALPGKYFYVDITPAEENEENEDDDG